MNAHYSKSAFVHRQVRRALRSGHYAPGQRIDPSMLAAEFRTSPTPVRFALYRLVGEGLLTDHARSGLYVPLPTEMVLRDLYDWMERLLSMACGIEAAAFVPAAEGLSSPSVGDDTVKLTWQLFDDISLATGHRILRLAVRQTNDRLAPIRRAKQGLVDGTFEELSELLLHWRKRDVAALDSALRGYHGFTPVFTDTYKKAD